MNRIDKDPGSEPWTARDDIRAVAILNKWEHRLSPEDDQGIRPTNVDRWVRGNDSVQIIYTKIDTPNYVEIRVGGKTYKPTTAMRSHVIDALRTAPSFSEKGLR